VGVKDKPAVLAGLCQQLGVSSSDVLFLGDDLNDLAVQGCVGGLIATADASLALREQADAVLDSRGGHGAVRELSERILRAREAWTELSQEGWRDRND